MQMLQLTVHREVVVALRPHLLNRSRNLLLEAGIRNLLAVLKYHQGMLKHQVPPNSVRTQQSQAVGTGNLDLGLCVPTHLVPDVLEVLANLLARLLLCLLQ